MKAKLHLFEENRSKDVLLLTIFPQVWTFNDFMGQYNQLYAYLNNIQVIVKYKHEI